jgi:hypothetical protein
VKLINVDLWNSKKGIYSCAKTWEFLRQKKPEVPWFKVVWFPLAITRHAFMHCLVVKGALVTKVKMCGWGFGGDTLCHFCYSNQESVKHLFFHCSFSRRVWRDVMEGCMVNLEIEWEKVMDWCVAKITGKSLMENLCRLCLAASVYNLWKLRNDL